MPRNMFALLLVCSLAAFLGGAGYAVQAGVSSEATKLFGHGIPSSLLTQLGGLVTMVVAQLAMTLWRRYRRENAAAVKPLEADKGVMGAMSIEDPADPADQATQRGADVEAAGTSGDAPAALRLHWWHTLGGVTSAAYATCVSVFAAPMGFGTFFVLVVTGEMLCGLLLDHMALMGLTRRRATPARLLGAGLLVLGAVLSSSAQLGRQGGVLMRLLMAALTLLAGAALPLHSAVNRHFGKVLGNNVRAAELSFAVGVLCMAGVTGAFMLAGKVSLSNFTAPARTPRAWMFTAGLLGSGNTLLAIVITSVVGVGVHFICVVAGQLFTSMVLDAMGAFGAEAEAFTRARTLGALCALLGAAVCQAQPAALRRSWLAVRALVHPVAPEPVDEVSSAPQDVASDAGVEDVVPPAALAA